MDDQILKPKKLRSTLIWVCACVTLGVKENCHNFRTKDDIDMKLGPITNLDKRKKKG